MIDYDTATNADDALLRQLLRENAMSSWVTMTLEREPSYFASMNLFGEDYTAIARQGSDTVGMYSYSTQPVFFNGAPASVGYLGALRVARSFRHQLRAIRGGFSSIGRFRPQDSQAPAFTAIATGNKAARRLLEANLRGLPTYRYLNELTILALPTSRQVVNKAWRRAQPVELDRVCSFYAEQSQAFNFAPRLTPVSLAKLGLQMWVVEEAGRLVACAALWNQQAHKQVVAQSYRFPLKTLLPLYNCYSKVFHWPPLPTVGHGLDQAYLAFFARSVLCTTTTSNLIAQVLSLGDTAIMSLGLHGGHSDLPTLLHRFKPFIYSTRIYSVMFSSEESPDTRPAQPEAALL
jgi:hypothetical protein